MYRFIVTGREPPKAVIVLKEGLNCFEIKKEDPRLQALHTQ